MKTTIHYLSSDNITFYRVIAMSMVVLYHCTCYYAHPSWPFGEGPYNPIMKLVTTIMGGIHMPVFVFISGYLFWMLKRNGHYKKLTSFYKTKVLRILVPYLIVGVIMIMLFNHIYNLSSLLYGICHLWFLLMLFGLFILAPVSWMILEKISDNQLVTFFVLSSFILYPIFYQVTIFQIVKVFQFLPFFLFGYIIQRRGLRNLYFDYLFWLSMLFVIMILYVTCSSNLFYGKILKQFISFLVIIIISLIPNFDIPISMKKTINSIAYNSMGLYLVHHIIINYLLLSSTTKALLDSANCYLAVTIMFLVTFFSSLLISVIANKYNFTSFIIGSKLKKIKI